MGGDRCHEVKRDHELLTVFKEEMRSDRHEMREEMKSYRKQQDEAMKDWRDSSEKDRKSWENRFETLWTHMADQRQEQCDFHVRDYSRLL
jgi:hypothetical protein